MKKSVGIALAAALLAGTACAAGADDALTAEEVRPFLVPYKLGRPILAPSGKPGTFDELAVDHPMLFTWEGRFYLSYLGYDGIGYQSALAVSDDLVNWRKLGLIFKRNASSNAWDRLGRVVSGYVTESGFRENVQLLKKDGKYWMTYHAYPNQGYEAGGAANGLAWAERPDSLEWHCFDEPILTKNPKPGQWDSGGIYTASIVRRRDGWKLLYSAKERDVWPWHEQVGIADPVDDTFLHWKRRDAPPVLRTGRYPWCSLFCGAGGRYDKETDQYMGYCYGYDGKHAGAGFAISKDGENFRITSEPILRSGPPGSLDETHAHKTAHAWLNGDLYVIYCAVRPLKDDAERKLFKKKGWNEYRTLTIARSRPW